MDISEDRETRVTSLHSTPAPFALFRTCNHCITFFDVSYRGILLKSLPMPQPSAHSQQLKPVEVIERRILLIRGQKVTLDSDLARLYGVPTKVFNQAVKRNLDRFPEAFMFQLAWKEAQQVSRSQFVTLKRGQNPKYRPYAFTEHGVAMLSSVLKSKQAVQMNILIIRAFIRLREILARFWPPTKNWLSSCKSWSDSNRNKVPKLLPFIIW